MGRMRSPCGVCVTRGCYLAQSLCLGLPMTDSLALVGDTLGASLTVTDLRSSVAWYCDVLGFTVDRRHERDGRLIAVSLRAGAVPILLTQDNGAKGLHREKGVGFSLQITTQQPADALAARAKARGALLETEPMTAPHGPRIFRVRDPDGFLLTISGTHAA